MRKRLRMLVALLLVIGAQSLSAQESITLEQAIERGLKHSARLAEIEARQAGAAAAETGAGAMRLPVIAAQAGYMRTNHVEEFSIATPGQPNRILYPDAPNNYRTRIDLQWPIYTGGRVDALERAAAAETRAVGEDLAAARADLRLEITRAFWALVTARETEAVLRRSLERFDLHVRDLKARLEQGLISPHELSSAEAHHSRQRLLSIEAGTLRARAEADIRRLTGAPPDPILPVVTPAAPVNLLELGAVPFFRPERRALEQRLAAVQQREAAVASTRKPQIFVSGGYDVARPNPRIFPRVDQWEPSWDAAINLSWTFWDGGRRDAERTEVAAAARAAGARITEFDRQSAFELQSRALEVEAARAAISAAEDGHGSAVEARRVVDERYRAGVATSTDVVDAEIAVLQAALDRTRAAASLRIAEAALTRAAGRRP